MTTRSRSAPLASVHHRRRSKEPPLAALAAATLTFLSLIPAHAATDSWTNASGNGNWSTPSNWNTSTVPVANDTVFITGGPSIPVNAPWTVAYDFTGSATLNSLTISHSNGVILASANTLNIPTGALTTLSEFVGDSTSGGSKGMGIVNQSGGSDTATTFTLGRNATDTGTYNATSGAGVTATTLTVGSAGRGSFNLSPGFLSLRASGATAPSLTLGDAPGSNGTFTLSANSSIFAPNGTEIIGNNGNGNFTQTGGNNSLDTSNAGFTQIILGNQTNSTGSYNLQGGSVTATDLYVGAAGTGNFTHSGGFVTLLPVAMGGSIFTANFRMGTANGTGSYTLSGSGELLVVGGFEIIGGSGSGLTTFTQNGGVNQLVPAYGVATLMDVGDSPTGSSIYSLNAGTLSVNSGTENIGDEGNGTFVQTGGSNSAGTLNVGGSDFQTSSIVGTYSLSNGSLTADQMRIGINGAKGVFNQSGGTVTITPSGSLTVDSDSNNFTGSYSLTGGSLSTPALIVGTFISSNVATFSVSGTGALSTSALSIAFSGAVSLGGSQTLFDIANVSISGALSLVDSAKVLRTSAFSLGGSNNAWFGKLDLTSNKLILESSPATKATTLATLQNQILFGRTHSAGITSSTLPANFALALIDNAITQFTLFGGASVDANSILIAPELLGDANIDGHVDLSDLSTILNNFGAATPNWTSGNFDNAVTIDLTDLSDVLNNFGATNPSAFSFQPSAFSTTPEPATITLLPLFLLLCKRHRRQSACSSSHKEG